MTFIFVCPKTIGLNRLGLKITIKTIIEAESSILAFPNYYGEDCRPCVTLLLHDDVGATFLVMMLHNLTLREIRCPCLDGSIRWQLGTLRPARLPKMAGWGVKAWLKDHWESSRPFFEPGLLAPAV
jgi:hypothetical protein